MIENQNPTINTARVRKGFLKKYLPLILIVLVIALALTSAYFYKKSKAPEQASQAEIKSLIEKVGRLAVLPTDETPTIATVSDPNALKDQAFFVDAKKGDKVLIYSNAKKAVLYNPSQDKIVNIAPLNTDQQKASVQTNTTEVETKTQKKN
jgi:lipopolysaccharide export LptBFGC system permease protein LptF